MIVSTVLSLVCSTEYFFTISEGTFNEEADGTTVAGVYDEEAFSTAITKGGAAGGQRDNMLQYRVKESGEVVIEVVLSKFVEGEISVLYTYFFPTVWKQMNSAQTVFM
jgi:hypothetical protein